MCFQSMTSSPLLTGTGHTTQSVLDRAPPIPKINTQEVLDTNMHSDKEQARNCSCEGCSLFGISWPGTLLRCCNASLSLHNAQSISEMVEKDGLVAQAGLAAATLQLFGCCVGVCAGGEHFFKLRHTYKLEPYIAVAESL